MNLKLADLERTLLASARANPPGDHVPYAFEKRIMARLKEAAAVDRWTLWARALWRAATPCVALTLLLSAWTFLSGFNGAMEPLATDFETAIYSPLDTTSESW